MLTEAQKAEIYRKAGIKVDPIDPNGPKARCPECKEQVVIFVDEDDAWRCTQCEAEIVKGVPTGTCKECGKGIVMVLDDGAWFCRQCGEYLGEWGELQPDAKRGRKKGKGK